MIVERDVDAWERSVYNSIAEPIEMGRKFPVNVIQYFDTFMRAFVTFHDAFERVMFHDKGVRKGMEDAKRDSILEYVYLPLCICSRKLTPCEIVVPKR